MSAYTVKIPMLTAAAFPATLKRSMVPTYYLNDVITGAEQRDIDRLLEHGWIEPVAAPDEQSTQPAVVPAEA